jgi:hypothetical protein
MRLKVDKQTIKVSISILDTKLTSILLELNTKNLQRGEDIGGYQQPFQFLASSRCLRTDK